MAERSAADTKIKSLEEQMTLSEDNISKVIGLAKNLSPVINTRREKYLTENILNLLQTNNKIQVVSRKIFFSTRAAGEIESLGVKDKFLAACFVKYLATARSSDDVLQAILGCKVLYEARSEKSVLDSKIINVKSTYSYSALTANIDYNKTIKSFIQQLLKCHTNTYT